MRRREIAEGDDHRRLADDAVLAVDVLRQLRERLQAVAGLGLPGGLEAVFWAALASFLPAPFTERVAASTAARRSCSDSRAYQMSIVRISANSSIASR